MHIPLKTSAVPATGNLNVFRGFFFVAARGVAVRIRGPLWVDDGAVRAGVVEAVVSPCGDPLRNRGLPINTDK
jgi:hypothetical protein